MAVFAFAGYAQKITVISGSVAPLKDPSVIAFEFTYDNMIVGKMSEAGYVEKKVTEYNEKEPGRGDEWNILWVADRANRFEPKFIELFDKHMEPYGMSYDEPGKAKFIISINTDFTEPGFNVGVVRRNAEVSLTLKITDTGTGEQVGIVKILNSSANNFWGTDFESGYRIQECYAKAGREFAKFIIKKNKM